MHHLFSSVLKYQHWVRLLNALPGLRLVNLLGRVPDKGLVIGGELMLKGEHISLTCFHGSNFRAQNWALFTLEEPLIQVEYCMLFFKRSKPFTILMVFKFPKLVEK